MVFKREMSFSQVPDYEQLLIGVRFSILHDLLAPDPSAPCPPEGVTLPSQEHSLRAPGHVGQWAARVHTPHSGIQSPENLLLLDG